MLYLPYILAYKPRTFPPNFDTENVEVGL